MGCKYCSAPACNVPFKIDFLNNDLDAKLINQDRACIMEIRKDAYHEDPGILCTVEKMPHAYFEINFCPNCGAFLHQKERKGLAYTFGYLLGVVLFICASSVVLALAYRFIRFILKI